MNGGGGVVREDTGISDTWECGTPNRASRVGGGGGGGGGSRFRVPRFYYAPLKFYLATKKDTWEQHPANLIPPLTTKHASALSVDGTPSLARCRDRCTDTTLYISRGNSRKIEVYKAVTISPKRRPGALLWGPRAHWGCAVVLDC